MFKPRQVFLQQHELFFTFGIPQVNLRKTASAILYLPQRECAVRCVWCSSNSGRDDNNNKHTPPGSSKLNTGVSVLNVVDFFMMIHSFLIYLLHVFCYLSKHVLWKSSSLNVKLTVAMICIFIKLEAWSTRMVFITCRRWDTSGICDVLQKREREIRYSADFFFLNLSYGSISYVGLKNNNIQVNPLFTSLLIVSQRLA